MTLIGVLVQIAPESNFIRWRNLCYLLFLVGAAFYLTTVRFGFAASTAHVSDEDLRQRWPDDEEFSWAKQIYARSERRLEHFTATAFEVANTCLLGGILVLLVPGGPWQEIPPMRWGAISVAGLCVVMAICLPVLHRTSIDWLPGWVQQLVTLHIREIRALEEGRGEGL